MPFQFYRFSSVQLLMVYGWARRHCQKIVLRGGWMEIESSLKGLRHTRYTPGTHPVHTRGRVTFLCSCLMDSATQSRLNVKLKKIASFITFHKSRLLSPIFSFFFRFFSLRLFLSYKSAILTISTNVKQELCWENYRLYCDVFTCFFCRISTWFFTEMAVLIFVSMTLLRKWCFRPVFKPCSQLCVSTTRMLSLYCEQRLGLDSPSTGCWTP